MVKKKKKKDMFDAVVACKEDMQGCVCHQIEHICTCEIAVLGDTQECFLHETVSSKALSSPATLVKKNYPALLSHTFDSILLQIKYT